VFKNSALAKERVRMDNFYLFVFILNLFPNKDLEKGTTYLGFFKHPHTRGIGNSLFPIPQGLKRKKTTKFKNLAGLTNKQG